MSRLHRRGRPRGRLLLPLAVRRWLFRWRAPERFEELQALRSGCDESGYSLEPFDRYRCLFVHVPKVAGVAISRALFGNLGGGHRTLEAYRLIFTRSQYASYFKFAFVRNPWDRLHSAYRFLRAGGFQEEDRVWAREHLAGFPEFREFVLRWVTAENIRMWNHFRLQSDFVVVSRGPGLDFLGYFENLDDDFRAVAHRLGLRARLEVENRGPEPRRSYLEDYDEASCRRVSEVYREDIARFGYTFDNSSLSAQLAARAQSSELA